MVVLDPSMRIVRFNRVCEETTGYSFADVRSRFIWDLMTVPEQAELFRNALQEVQDGRPVQDFEVGWEGRGGERRLISWSLTALRGAKGTPQYFIAAGTDITVRKRLETAVMEVSGREQRRIGQDLHDGLGQLLTGIAFMSKVQEQRLVENGVAGSRGSIQNCSIGERSDSQSSRAFARPDAGAGETQRSDVEPGADGPRSGGSVWRLVPVLFERTAC